MSKNKGPSLPLNCNKRLSKAGEVMWWLTRPYLPGMWEMLKERAPHPAVIVELGANIGRWTEKILSMYSGDDLKQLFCVDLWPQEEVFEEWKRRCGGDPRAVAIKMKTTDASKKFSQKIDLLYVDAAHKYENVLDDLNSWIPKVKTGGLVLMDDYNMGGVRRALQVYCEEQRRTPKIHVAVWGGDPNDLDEQAWFFKDWEGK